MWVFTTQGFYSVVAERQGIERERLYTRVWAELRALEGPD